MSATSNEFGYEIYCDEPKDPEQDYYEGWIFTDTGESILNHKRKCPKCGKRPTKKGHDPCISNLPGVKFACCGHGTHKGYIVFENGVTIRGKFEID